MQVWRDKFMPKCWGCRDIMIMISDLHRNINADMLRYGS